MSVQQDLATIRDETVLDFFCPEKTRSCPPVMAKRVYDLCFAASITTVGQLADMKPSELRAKSFPDDLIPYICLKLQQAHPALNLTPDFSKAAGAQGRAPSISFLPTADSAANGYKLG